jgi:hypothetical protein
LIDKVINQLSCLKKDVFKTFGISTTAFMNFRCFHELSLLS